MFYCVGAISIHFECSLKQKLSLEKEYRWKFPEMRIQFNQWWGFICMWVGNFSKAHLWLGHEIIKQVPSTPIEMSLGLHWSISMPEGDQWRPPAQPIHLIYYDNYEINFSRKYSSLLWTFRRSPRNYTWIHWRKKTMQSTFLACC